MKKRNNQNVTETMETIAEVEEKKGKKLLKSITMLPLLALLFGSGSGIAVYTLLNNNRMSDNAETNNFIVDDFIEISDNETGFSKTLNSLINAKEITGNLALGMDAAGQHVDLNLRSMDIDLSELNTMVINLATDINVQYRKLDQTMSLRVEDDQAAYVSYQGRGFTFNIPTTLSDIMGIVSSVGVAVPNLASGTSDLNLTSILNSVKEYADMISVTEDSEASAGQTSGGDDSISVSSVAESTNQDGDHVYKIAIDDITVKNTSVKNITLYLTSDKDYNIKDIYTETGKSIDIYSGEEKQVSITLNGSLNAKSVSDYAKASTSDFADVTGINSSILSTVANIVKKKQTGIGIDVQLKKNNEDWFDITGSAQIDCSSIGSNFAKGNYALTLNHLSGDGTSGDALNSLSAIYNGKDIYMSFDDLFKGKVSDTTLSKLFDCLSEGTGKNAISVIANELNTATNSVDINGLTENDLSSVNDFLNSGKASLEALDLNNDKQLESLRLSLEGSAIGLGDTTVTLTIKCNDDGIESIKVGGLLVNEYSCDVTLKVSDYDSSCFSELKDSDYSDYKGIAPIFDSLAGIVADRKFAAHYSFSYNQLNDDEGKTLNHSNLIASGDIGADLSQETIGEKIKTGYQDGNYYLTMNAASSNSQYQYGLNLNYQNRDLYFAFGQNSDGLPVFKNRISNAQMGQMMDIVDTKTESSSSEVFTSSSSILDYLSLSEGFQDDIEKIKSGSLNGLQYLHISAADDGDKNHISVSVDINKLFDEKSMFANLIDSISFSLNTNWADSDDPFFEDISIVTRVNSKEDYTFTLSFLYGDDRNTAFQNNILTINDELKGSYPLIDDLNDIFDAFYNIPTQIKKYGVKVEANYGDFALKGGARWDVSDTSSPKVDGTLTVTHPYIALSSSGLDTTDSEGNTITADQKIDFSYQNDETKGGQFIAEYNDNMHILMHTATISDLVDVVSDRPETGLLNNLLTTGDSVASSMNISDAISSMDTSGLLDYPYVYSANIDSSANTITLKLDKRLFNVDYTGTYVTMTIGYSDGTDTTDPTIDYLKMDLDGSTKGETIATAKITFAPYDNVYGTETGDVLAPEITPYNDETKAQFVDLDGFSNLLKMAVDTTEFNYFKIKGSLNLNMSLFNNSNITDWLALDLDAYKFNLSITAEMYIADNTTYAYLDIKLNKNDITQAGYYDTEFFLSGDSIYINNVRTDYDKTQKTNVVSAKGMKVSMDEFQKNLPYYLCSVVLDMDDRLAGKTVMANVYKMLGEADAEDDSIDITESASGGTESISGLTDDLNISLANDFSSVIEAGALYDESRSRFAFNLNLNNILKVTYGSGDEEANLIDFDSTYLNLYHMTASDGRTPFFGLSMHTGLNVLDGLFAIDLDAKFASNATNSDMAYFASGTSVSELGDSKMARFNSYISNFTADNYQIDSFHMKTKKFYSFSSNEMFNFANDYDVNDNGNAMTSSYVIGSTDTIADRWLFNID